MQEKIKFAMITAFLLLSLATISSASAANTYQITDSSYSNYFNTTGYITNSNVQAGDVFDISGDINNKDMYIDRPLNITSSDRTGQIINGTITILSGGSGTNVNYLNITNNKTNNNSYGIHLIESNNNRIIGNNITTTGNGTGASGNGYLTYGVYLEDSSNNLFDSNKIKTTGISTDADYSAYPDPAIYATTGVYLKSDSNNNIFTNNNITTDYNDVVSSSGYDTLAGVRIIGSTNNRFTGNHINTVGNAYAYGVGIAGTTSSTASNNAISENIINSNGANYANGVEIDANTNDTVVSQNIVKAAADSFAYGIYLAGAYGTPTNLNVTITGNKVTTIGNINYVLELFSTNDNTITDNVLVGVGNYSLGIGTCGSSNNTIKYNTIITIGDNSAEHIYNGDSIPEGNEGIKLYSDSNQNTMQHNIINSSALYAIDTTKSSNNTITNNYLVADKGDKIGDNAVNSGTGDIINNNTPATVTVTPSPGYYKNSIQVTLKINIPGTIYYTTNGTTPTTKSTKYTKPINISKTTTLKFITIDTAGNKSPIQTKTYIIDTVKPVISSTDPKNGANNVTRNKAIKVTFSENIRAGSNWIELKSSKGTTVTIGKSISGKVLTINHAARLAANTKYTLILHTGSVTDLAGNPVALKTITFTTGKT